MKMSSVADGRRYKLLALILLCGGVLYYFMVSTLDFKLTIASTSQIIHRPMKIEDLVIKPLQNKTKPHSGTVKPAEIVRDVKNVHESSGPSAQVSNKTIHSDRKIVLIVAYMRTGSTLTASLLQEYPRTFYVFEPIRSIIDAFGKLRRGNNSHFTMKYIHNKERKFIESDELGVIFDELNAWLTCQLDSISINSLTDSFHKYYTKIMKNFYYCYKGYSSRVNVGISDPRMHPQLRHYFNTKKTLDTCLKASMNSCKASPLLVLKFIRIRMREVMKLLPFFPNMKIIHLVRDPRGILNSRIHVKAVGVKKYQSDVKDLCDSLEEDLVYTKALLKTTTDRAKILHYEDMAERPVEVAEEVAQFVGIEFTKSMQTFIRKQTSSSRDSCSYCTQRRNSTATAHKWRSQLKPEQAMYIYNACRRSNEVLGYLPFSSKKEQTDATEPSRKIFDTRSVLLSNENF